jgi:hypothetical protein
MTWRGIIIRESLRTEELPPSLQGNVSDQYKLNLGGIGEVEIIEVKIPKKEIANVSLDITVLILPEKYYAHFVDKEKMYVIFPSIICLVYRGDIKSAERCRQVGTMFSIPNEQMQFEKMFEVDHPDVT